MAVVVICVGLLGIAKMQAMALSNTNMSRQRSLAAIEAASIAASMHSNRQYWALAIVTPFSVSISGNPAVVASSDGGLQAQTTADLTNLTACIGNNTGAVACNNPSDLAAFDLARWWVTSVSVQLPNPTATVTCPLVPAGNAAPISCTDPDQLDRESGRHECRGGRPGKSRRPRVSPSSPSSPCT